MSMTDPIADLLTRIRNAYRAHHDKVDIPASKLKERITYILKREGYVEDYRLIEDNRQGVLRVFLRYSPDKEPAIAEIQRVSRPGRRVYVKTGEVPRIIRGFGVAIVSTSRGVMSDREARKAHIGGEVLCYVW